MRVPTGSPSLVPEQLLDAVPRERSQRAADRDEGDEGRREMDGDGCAVGTLVDLEIGIVGERTWDRITARAWSRAPGRIRTCDLEIRRLLLCPAELRALGREAHSRVAAAERGIPS